MTATLPRRPVGSTGIALSELSFGAAGLGNLYRAIDDDTALTAVGAAWDLGIRYFDTAPHYGLGLSERRLGAALAGRPRDDFVLSTKVGRLLAPHPRPTTQDTEGFAVPGDLRRVWDMSPDGVRRSLDASLQRLGVDRVDIVFVHDPDQYRASAAREGLAALAELRAQGVVGAIGIGTNTAAQLPGLFADGLLDVAMVAGRYTLLEQESAAAALAAAGRAGASVVAAAVFNSGLLSAARPVAGARYDYGEAPAELIQRAVRLADVCEGHGVSLPEAAIAFPLRHPAVATVTVGMRTTEQVTQNVQRYRRPVPEALWVDLAAAGLLPAATSDTVPTKETEIP